MTALDRLLERLRRALHIKPRVVLPNQVPWSPTFYRIVAAHMDQAALAPVDRSIERPHPRAWL